VYRSELIKISEQNFIKLPTPSSISYFWNFGAILGVNLISQIISGFLISFHYSNNIKMAFKSYINLSRNINSGSYFKYLHVTGASSIFLIIYLHIYRNIQNKSFKNKKV